MRQPAPKDHGCLLAVGFDFKALLGDWRLGLLLISQVVGFLDVQVAARFRLLRPSKAVSAGHRYGLLRFLAIGRGRADASGALD